VRVKNWFDFINAKAIAAGNWELTASGRVVETGGFPQLDIKPGAEKEFQLKLPEIKPAPGVEYWLNVSFVLNQELSWASKGHEIAWDQFPMPVGVAGPRIQLGSQVPLEVADEKDSVTLSGPQFTSRLDKALGLITQFRYKGVDLLERGPRPDFWRTPTNNDRGAWKIFRQRAATDKSVGIALWEEAGPQW
jgi:beta-galactosidase